MSRRRFARCPKCGEPSDATGAGHHYAHCRKCGFEGTVSDFREPEHKVHPDTCGGGGQVRRARHLDELDGDR